MESNILNAKQKKLIKLLKSYPRPNHTDDDACGLIIGILISANENEWTEDFIKICEENPSVTFDDIISLIMTEERYPTLEIVDHEEDE